MIRKLKALGPAVFVFVAFSAAPASASEFKFEQSHIILSASQHAGEDELTVNAGTVKCNEATYAGTQETKETSTIRVTPTYSKCSAFGFVSTTIDVNGCEYVFHTEPGTVVTEGPGAVRIICPTEKSIVITAFNCEVTVGPQGPLSGVTYTNKGAGAAREVTVDMNSTGASYIQHSKSFPGCSANSTNPRTDGTYKGSLTVKGADTNGNQVGVWVH